MLNVVSCTVNLKYKDSHLSATPTFTEASSGCRTYDYYVSFKALTAVTMNVTVI
jgi:hypothetical protein